MKTLIALILSLLMSSSAVEGITIRDDFYYVEPHRVYLVQQVDTGDLEYDYPNDIELHVLCTNNGKRWKECEIIQTTYSNCISFEVTKMPYSMNAVKEGLLLFIIRTPDGKVTYGTAPLKFGIYFRG